MKQPNFYSIMPAHIRYSNVLSDFEKILFSEIVALSNALGYCYASNNYFAKVYNKSTRTISQGINNLAKYEYIKIYIEQEKGNKRRLYVVLENYFKMMKFSKKQQKSIHEKMDNTTYQINKGGIEENVYSPMEENFQYNNTSNNTITKGVSNIEDKPNIKELFDRFYKRSIK